MSQTESFSKYEDLEKKSTLDLLNIMNEEDKKVPIIISKSLKSINTFIEEVYNRMKKGGRLFYIGSGTPGRLGIVDASECPPTFGVSNNEFAYTFSCPSVGSIVFLANLICVATWI